MATTCLSVYNKFLIGANDVYYYYKTETNDSMHNLMFCYWNHTEKRLKANVYYGNQQLDCDEFDRQMVLLYDDVLYGCVGATIMVHCFLNDVTVRIEINKTVFEARNA
jgi:hypothetical protein